MEEIKRKKGFKFTKNKDKEIIRDIKEYFEEPTIFLKRNNKIGIGKSSLKQRNSYINNINNIISNINSNNNNMKPFKGKTANTDNELSTIPNLSLIQKTINSKEEIPFNNNILLNTNSIIKGINNKEIINKEILKNNWIDSKKDNNNIISNTEDKKKNLIFNSKNNTNKKIETAKTRYCITESNNPQKNNRFTNFLSQNKKITLISKNRNKKLNNDNYNISQGKKLIKNKIKITNPIKYFNRPLSANIHYQYKLSDEIIKSYIQGKNREKESKIKGTNYFIPKEVEEKIKRKYLSQEKNLKKKAIHSYKDKKI